MIGLTAKFPPLKIPMLRTWSRALWIKFNLCRAAEGLPLISIDVCFRLLKTQQMHVYFSLRLRLLDFQCAVHVYPTAGPGRYHVACSRAGRFTVQMRKIHKYQRLPSSALPIEATRALKKSIRGAYELLVPKLARLVGHRVEFHREPMASGLAFSYADSGLLLYRLDAGQTESVAHMEVDQSAKTDDFATKTIRHFQAKARRCFLNARVPAMLRRQS
jgi:hypothetical protein